MPSAGMAFLNAARDGMPSTIGDRVRIQAMSEAMSLAIRCKFKFDNGDAAKLAKGGYRIETSVGVFRPLDASYYSAACVYGGTYARMWEAHHGQKPWFAPRVAGRANRGSGGIEELGENRVAEGLAVLIACEEGADEAGLARIRDGRQVWWCTSVSDVEIIVCRYRYEVGCRYPYDRGGSPARRLKMNRKEWEAFVREPVPTAALDGSVAAAA